MNLKEAIFSGIFKEDIKTYNKDKIKINQELSYMAYMDLILKTKKLLKGMYINDPLEIKIIFEYLLYNGYFSIDKKFKLSSENRKLNIYIPGADIMGGTGVCINIGDLLKEIYNAYGYKAHIISCKYDINAHSKKTYKPEIKQKIGEINLKDDERHNIKNYILQSFIGNHIITLVNYNKKTYLCDPTNLDFISIKENNKGKSLFHKTKTTILPEYFGILDNKLNKLNSLLKNTTNLNYKEIIALYNNIIHLCEKNKYTFDRFHESIKTDINIVSKTLK